jgi:hypothetical protein
MPDENPLRPISDDANPYAPPAAPDLEPVEPMPAGDQAAAEAIRKAHLSHEASIRSIGSLHYLAAAGGVCGAASSVLLVSFSPRGQVQPGSLPMLGVGILGMVYLAMAGLHVALGFGLSRLQSWARWTDVVLVSLVLALYALGAVLAMIGVAAGGGNSPEAVGVVIGTVVAVAILGYILYLLLAAKAGVIFSPQYKAIIAQTPHIKYRTSVLLKIAVALILLVVVLAILGAIIGRSS